jgi:hypothetical protein
MQPAHEEREPLMLEIDRAGQQRQHHRDADAVDDGSFELIEPELRQKVDHF